YRVLISGRPVADAIRRPQEGMAIGAERFAPIGLEVIEGAEGADEQTLVRRVLQEGRKREVRRLWGARGDRVLALDGIRMGPSATTVPGWRTRSNACASRSTPRLIRRPGRRWSWSTVATSPARRPTRPSPGSLPAFPGCPRFAPSWSASSGPSSEVTWWSWAG